MEKFINAIPKSVSLERPEKWEHIRHELLSLPQRTEGLDLQRVKDFIASKGLSAVEMIVYEENDIPKIKEIVSGEITDDSFNNYGFCAYGLGLVFVKRNALLEKINGPEYTESVAVHEQTHASSGYTVFLELQDKTTTGRGGFMVPRFSENGHCSFHGDFFEEGFSGLLEAEFLERFGKERNHKMEEWFPDSASLDHLNEYKTEDEKIKFQIPLKYLTLLKYHQTGYSSVSIQAFGVELLCKKIPELYDTMLRARTDINELRKIPKLINASSDGLYGRLAALSSEPDSAAKGLVIIVGELYGGNLPPNKKRGIIRIIKELWGK